MHGEGAIIMPIKIRARSHHGVNAIKTNEGDQQIMAETKATNKRNT